MFGRTVAGAEAVPVLDGLGLRASGLVPGLDPAVVSTGLRYLVIPVTAGARAGRVALNKPFVLHQGRFTGRPSQLQVEPRGGHGAVDRVLVGGQIAMVASGTLRALPGAPAR